MNFTGIPKLISLVVAIRMKQPTNNSKRNSKSKPVPPPPAKPRRTWLVIVGVLVLTAIIFYIFGQHNAQRNAASAADTTRTDTTSAMPGASGSQQGSGSTGEPSPSANGTSNAPEQPAMNMQALDAVHDSMRAMVQRNREMYKATKKK